MNFEQWFKSKYNSEFGVWPQDEEIELGWQACKKEVLKIIQNNIGYGDVFKNKKDAEHLIKLIKELWIPQT